MTTQQHAKKFSHYYKEVPQGVTHIDVYVVLRLWNVEDPAIAHALKKLLCAGSRGAKGRDEDLAEAVASVQRAMEIDREFAAEKAGPG